MLVVDASVAVKLLVEEPGSDDAAALVASAQDVIAPDWLILEVAHALWCKVKFETLDQQICLTGIERLPSFFDRFIPSPDLLAHGFELAFQLNHAIYDCLYLALAVREKTNLLTADKKFWNAAKRVHLEHHIELLRWPG
jgi:predicted nucleic acid-binding protein